MITDLFNKTSKKLPSIAAFLALMLAVGWASDTYLVDPEGTREYLEKELKFTDVKTGKHAWFGCNSDEPFSLDTKFTATNTLGEKISGAYCQGLIPYHVVYKRFIPN